MKRYIPAVDATVAADATVACDDATGVRQVDRANSFVVDSRKRPRSSMGTGWMEPAKSRNSRGDQVFHRSVTTVEWMPDGQKFMTAGQDGLVKVCPDLEWRDAVHIAINTSVPGAVS